ncbi:MAG: helix-turn-helix domain-containing protein [Chloroflexota bacterium]
MEALDKVLTPEQVAEYLKLNRETIYRYIREGKLSASRFGRSYRITGRDLELFLLAASTSPVAREALFSRLQDIAERNRAIPFEEVERDVAEAISIVAKSAGIEQEIILLMAVEELIDLMVNFELMSLLGNDPDSNILFKSITHQRFFNIILVDFLSCTDAKSPIEKTSYLGGLRGIVNKPNFNENNSVENLSAAIKEFKDWLEQEIQVPLWLPSISKDAILRITRFQFLKMTGNLSKHNYLRAFRVAEELRNILLCSGITVNSNEALLALADFYERFHNDILNYYGSTLAEFLNNIRWGIYEYLQPELQRSIVYEGSDPLKYSFRYPEGIKSEYAKMCYWDLMNEVKAVPYVRRFKVTKWLKTRY